MRISDWSSDVCSSDLSDAGTRKYERSAKRSRRAVEPHAGLSAVAPGAKVAPICRRPARSVRESPARQRGLCHLGFGSRYRRDHERPLVLRSQCFRSEEHTSELQSLMRISYAVFCLKKKKTHYHYLKDSNQTTTN